MAQCTTFWSPLNDPASFPSRRNQPTNNGADCVEEDSGATTGRRYPEFQAWFEMTRTVILVYVCTFFSVLDIPVYAPILWAYLAFFGLVALIQTIRMRREANRIPVSNDEDEEATTDDAVRIHLRACGSQDFSAITKISPWCALKSPPASLHINQATWRDFLTDLEAGMTDNENDRARALAAFGKLLSIVFVCSYFFFDALYQSPHIPPYCVPIEKGCKRLVWVSLMAHIPSAVYAVIAFRSLQDFQKQRLARLADSVEQVLADVRAENPHISLKLTRSKWNANWLVEVGPHHETTKTAMATADSQHFSPNPETEATDPLLV
jgi:hypothetical protein